MRTSLKKIFNRIITSASKEAVDVDRYGINNSLLQLQIEISHKESTKYENVTEFWFKPSYKIKIKEIRVEIENDEDIISGDNALVYSDNEWHLFAGYEDVRPGDRWMFIFTCIFNDSGDDFAVTVEYEI